MLPSGVCAARLAPLNRSLGSYPPASLGSTLQLSPWRSPRSRWRRHLENKAWTNAHSSSAPSARRPYRDTGHASTSRASFVPWPPLPPTLPIRVAAAPFQKVASCLVYRPATPPRATVNFVGGSFIGGAPDIFYGYFIKLLVDEGFLVIATLYDVSLDHILTAGSVQDRFAECLHILDEGGLPFAGLAPGEASRLPVFGVGHSLGALMLALIGTQEGLLDSPAAPAGNVIISYTNRSASSLGGDLDSVRPDAASAPNRTVQTLASSAPGVLVAGLDRLRESLERVNAPLFEIIPEEVRDPWLRFYASFGPAASDFSRGITDYFPTPAENLRSIAKKYSVPSSLVIQCKVDPVEDSVLLEEAIQERAADGTQPPVEVKRVVLPGTHFTPAAPDVYWAVGRDFGPAEAVIAAAKSSYLSDIRLMSRTTADWIREQASVL